MTENPPLLQPDAWDVAFAAIPVAILALTIIGLISIARVIRHHPGPTPIVWLLVVFLLPIVGAVLWFAVGRRSVLGSPTSPTA